MGRASKRVRNAAVRSIRKAPLTAAERKRLGALVYEGNPQHKRRPGDFGLTPPAAPRPDKTLCDEAGILTKAQAQSLLVQAVQRGLVSVQKTPGGCPKHLWVVDEKGRVFEAVYGGSRKGYYHGFPIRKSDPLFEEVRRLWNKT